MMNKILPIILLFSPIFTFSQDSKAVEIIDKCIKAHGGKSYEKFAFSLDFRQFHLVLKQNKGMFHYERSMTDSNKVVWHDVLNNDGFYREKAGVKVELSEKDRARYLEGVNSQAYFILLPYKLKDKAVILTYVGEGVVEGKKQHKIEVAFQKEGGGRDFEDVYCYWINQQTYLIDYIAYSAGGPRFRKTIKRQNAGKVVIQDYENYEIKDKTIKTRDYDRIYMEGGAKLLSKIEHTNIRILK